MLAPFHGLKVNTSKTGIRCCQDILLLLSVIQLNSFSFVAGPADYTTVLTSEGLLEVSCPTFK